MSEVDAASYDFTLPPELIAQSPAVTRDASRLMLVAGDTLEHHVFRNLPALLNAGDLLVLNETRVIAARLFGRTADNAGGRVELLLLHPADSMRYDPTALRWFALARPARRLKAGVQISFGTFGHACVRRAEKDGIREIEFSLSLPFEEFLMRAGRLPLPPYIHNDTEAAQLRYQTVFARIPGSVAAPTASLHFTDALLAELQQRGIEIVRLSLDVGLGTFRPMQTERIDRHRMHAEHFVIPAETARAVARAQREGHRIVAAGTTVVRALEGSAFAHGCVAEGEDATDIFITPGYTFTIVDAMITNFHLPRSTLLVMVSAFAGRERILRAYHTAIAEKYRFFSFGDAMLLTRVRRS